MKNLLLSAAFVIATFVVNAQPNAAEIKEKDSTIMADMITPALNTALEDKAEPDWNELAVNIKAAYGDYYANRMPIKGEIHFYYGRNWPKFTKAIVQFTEKYEDKENLKLLDKNANFVLKNSNDKGELKTAAEWSRRTLDKEPSNETYQTTYKALLEKLK